MRLAGDLAAGEILRAGCLGGVDQDERDVGSLGRLERAELGVVLDSLSMLPLPAKSGRVDEDERAVAALEDGVDRVARRSRNLGDDDSLAADDRVEVRRLAHVRMTEDRDADRIRADRRASLA